MSSSERAFLLERLESSQAELKEILDSVHGDQWTFREAADRWSIAENLEHLILFELFIRQVVARILSESAREEALPPVEDTQVLGLREVGDTKLKSREAALPKGTLGDPEELLRQFQRERNKTIAYASTVEGDLRAYRFEHLVLGELDAYQWLLVIAQHTKRHIAQMKAVMSHSDFPD